MKKVAAILFCFSIWGCEDTTSEQPIVEFPDIGDLSIEGKWLSCTTFANGSELYESIYDQNTWQDTYTAYLDDSCQQVDESESEEIYTGGYTLGKEIDRQQSLRVFEITWTFDDENRQPCYTIIGVQDDSIMFYGDNSGSLDCSTENKRPTKLDTDWGLIKAE